MKIKYSLIALACVSSLSYANNSNVYNLDDILVSTTSLGSEEKIADVQATIEVIDKKNIEKSNARSLPQLLNRAVGIDIKDAGSTSSMSLRGFSSSHTLLLVDGLRRTGKYGSFDLTSVQLEDIERIEIVRGPMSTIYGADAIAGVVNIITKKNAKEDYDKLSFTTGSTRGGQRETYITKFSGNKTIKNISHNYAFEFRKKGDYKEKESQVNTDLKNESRRFINYGHTIKIDDNNQITNKLEYAKQDDDGINSSNNITYEKEKRYQVASNYNHQDDKYIFDTSLGYGKSDTEVDRGSGSETTDYKELELNNYLRYFSSDSMTNILGAGYKNDKIDVSIYTKSASRDNFFALYQNEYDITDSLTSNIGIRYDKFNDFGSSVNPKISLMYKYSDFSFRTSYGTAFKAPSFTNMYSHFTRSQGPRISDISGNENLKPEESKTQEYAISYNKNNLDIELVHHRTQLENLINSYIVNTVGLTTYYNYHNIDKSTINGTELSLNYRFNNNFSINSSIEYLDTEDKATGERLTGSAKNTYKLSLDYEINKIGFYLDLKRLRSYYGADSDRTNKYTNYTLVDFKVNYNLSDKIAFFVGIDNLQNKKMPYNMTSRGTPNDPGERFYYTGMRYKF